MNAMKERVTTVSNKKCAVAQMAWEQVHAIADLQKAETHQFDPSLRKSERQMHDADFEAADAKRIFLTEKILTTQALSNQGVWYQLLLVLDCFSEDSPSLTESLMAKVAVRLANNYLRTIGMEPEALLLEMAIERLEGVILDQQEGADGKTPFGSYRYSRRDVRCIRKAVKIVCDLMYHKSEKPRTDEMLHLARSYYAET